jgi:uncharacterized protein (TIGR00251 family)
MADAFPFLKRTATGVTVTLRVKPRAKRSTLSLSPDGLKVAINAPPIDGRANDAIIAFLAETWRLPKSAFGIVKGTTSRTKTMAIAGEPSALAQRISDWASTHD